MAIAIIPARGGSKGVPGKNIKLLAGKPLLGWSIEHAKQSPDIQRVIVSTDDAAIAKVAQQFGAEIVQRPNEISGDTASSESALLHVLDHLRKVEGNEPELIVFLQATSPMRRPGEIQRAIDHLHRENADSLLSVCPMHGFLWRNQNGEVRSFSYDHRQRPRRQDAPEDLVENGSIYIFKNWVLRKFNNRLGGKVALHRMDPIDSFQIDDPGDFELISHLMSARLASTSADLSEIRLLVLDFDGVMTDNKVLVREDGTEHVTCSRGDGFGLGLLQKAGRVEVIVLSKEANPVVAARCRKLKLACIQGCDDKLPMLKKLAEERGLAADAIAYMGNDLNDLECMRWVGTPIAVRDAVPDIKAVARMSTRALGGQGAVREICDILLAQSKQK